MKLKMHQFPSHDQVDKEEVEEEEEEVKENQVEEILYVSHSQLMKLVHF